MKQTHFVLVLIIVLLAWLWGENVGQRFSPFFLGLSLPDGPPLGTVLVQKLEVFTSGMLLPVFCTMTGWRTNLQSLKHSPSSFSSSSSIWVVELIFLIGQLGKLLGTLLSSICLGVSLEDAVPLAFMMSFKGLMEIAFLGVWKDNAVLDDQMFSLSMINIVLFTGVAYPLVQYLYDPSMKYKTVRKRGIGATAETDGDLLILVCIHEEKEESVPTILNLLEATKFNSKSGGISVYALHLIPLSGSAMPVLMPLHKFDKKSSVGRHSNFNSLIDRTAKALQRLETGFFSAHGGGGGVVGYARVQQYVSVAPSQTIHDDICAVAHDRRISIIILPFHKQWGIDGHVEASSSQIRDINMRVLRKAPCSVAILIDKSSPASSKGMSKSLIVSNCGHSASYQIVMFFIGGSDDQEALALARRMAEHPNVKLTVIWLKAPPDYTPQQHHQELSPARVIKNFLINSKRHDRIGFKESVVANGIGTTKVVMGVQNTIDLIIVGRYHETDCPAIQGLSDWSDNYELGAMGDMLATSDHFQYSSILVVQQQPRIDWPHSKSSKHRNNDNYGHDDDDDEVRLSIGYSSFKSCRSTPSVG